MECVVGDGVDDCDGVDRVDDGVSVASPPPPPPPCVCTSCNLSRKDSK